MTDLVLSDVEQAAVRAIIASEAVVVDAPGGDVLRQLARLIGCDAMGVTLLDDTGTPVGEPTHGDHPNGDGPPVDDAQVLLGVHHRNRTRSPDGSTSTRGVAVLALGVRSGPHHVVKLWLMRSRTDFSARDVAVFGLITPALERMLREWPRSAYPPCLTVQERRVLHHVALGLSNAEIAERLVVTPSTVRKHLENAYRKLGVSNRLAAVVALERGRQVEEAAATNRPQTLT